MRRLGVIQESRAAALTAAGALTDAAELREERAMSEDETVQFTAHLDAVRAADAEIVDMQKRIDELNALEAARAAAPFVPQVNMNRDPRDLSDLRYGAGRDELQARVRHILSEDRDAVLPYRLSSRQKESVEDMLRRIDPVDGSLSRRILATSSRSYYNAFAKIMSGNEFALNEQERQAISEMRASLTDNAGGYAIPFSVDTTMISTDDGSVNPFRQISTVKQITADVWQGVSSAGVTASFDSEAAEVSDDSPTLAGPTITTYMARAFVPFSIEIGQDWANIDADLRSMFQDAKDDLETTAFSTGSGPIGIITALTGGSSEINAAGEAVALADLYSLDNALPARYRQNASWVANKSTYNAVRALDTYGGGGMWERIGAAMPARLLGYPVYESSAFDGSIDAGATANNYVAVLGDFKYFYIVDRVGMSVELIPHLFHTSNNLPSGRRGMFAHWRVGSDSVNDAAFRMLDVATTA